MGPVEDLPVPEKPKRQKSAKSNLHLLILLVILASLVMAAVYVNDRDDKREQTTKQNAQLRSEASLTLSPASQNFKVGDEITVAVWANSGGEPANAVQANIEYSADRLEFIDVSYEGSAYEVKAESTHEKGKIIIARGHVGELTEAQLVAKLNFKVLAGSEEATINFVDGSAIVSAKSNQSILKQSQGGTYAIEAKN